MSDDLVQILRQKANGQRNDCGDSWGDWLCASAANEIERLRAEVARLLHDNRILEIKNRGTLANNLCPDHRGADFTSSKKQNKKNSP